MTKYTLLTELCCRKEKMLLPLTDKNSYNLDICGEPHLLVNHAEKMCMFQQKHTFMKVTNKMQLYRLTL